MRCTEGVTVLLSLVFAGCVERFEVDDGSVLGTTTTATTGQGATTDAADTSAADASESANDSGDSSTGDCARCSNLDPDLHFTFDGHLDDVSGNGYHGVAVFESRYVTGLDSDALVFDADHPYLTANSFASAFESALRDEGITVTMRWRPSQYPPSDNTMLGLRDPGPTEMTFALSCTESDVQTWTPAGAATLAENPPTGEWVTQTFVINGNEVRYYEWGELKGDGIVDLSVSVGSELLVGGYAGENMFGRMDDLKVWLKPLSDADVLDTL